MTITALKAKYTDYTGPTRTIVNSNEYQEKYKVLGSYAIPAIPDIWDIIKRILDKMQMAGEILGKYYIERKAGVKNAVFRARNGLKNIAKKNNYLQKQAKAMMMQVGSSREMLKDLGKGAIKGLKITFFVSVAINSVDFLFKDEYRWSDWLGTTSTDIIKGVLSIGAANWGVIIALSLGAPVGIVTIGIGLLAGWAASYFLNEYDTNHKITESLIKKLNELEDWFFYKQTFQQREALRRKALIPKLPRDPWMELARAWQ